jgi:hypothetical protein
MASSQVESLERINALTSNFFFWQGLRWVPMGAALIVVAWSFSPSTPVPESWQSTLLIAVMAAAIALSVVAGRWYGRAFGRVRGIPGQHARRTRTKWLVVYPLIAVALLIDGIMRPPVLLSGFGFAAAIEAYRRSTGGGRRHYIVASVVFLALSFAPTIGLAAPGAQALNLLMAVLGATYVIGGVLDHLELRRLLPGSSSEAEEAQDSTIGASRSR